MIPIKKKPCKACGLVTYIFSHGNCKDCSTLLRMAKNKEKQATLRQTDQQPAKPFRAIKRVGDKQAKLNVAYRALRDVFIEQHPFCQAQWEGCTHTATECHHSRGRGEYGGKEVYQDNDGFIYDANTSERVGADYLGTVGTKPFTEIVLTIAHLDHDINNNDYSNLRALCQKCHNRYDRENRNANRKAKQEIKQPKLF